MPSPVLKATPSKARYIPTFHTKKPVFAKTGPRSVNFHVMMRPVKQKRANTHAWEAFWAPFAPAAMYSHSEGPSAATVAPL